MIELKKGLQHGSCVDFNGKGLLILGDPRSGKSSLALACMSIGAILVGDDYIVLNTCDNKIIANNPPNISGKIEVSRVGILNCDFIKKTKIDLVINMSEIEISRLPKKRYISLDNCQVSLIYGAKIPNLHSIALQYFKKGFAIK